MLIKQDQLILFQGDSITDCETKLSGWKRPGNGVSHVDRGLVFSSLPCFKYALPQPGNQRQPRR